MEVEEEEVEEGREALGRAFEGELKVEVEAGS